ncbi:MAG TPA: MEDS domain-containing protein [Bacteroidales bacterium]
MNRTKRDIQLGFTKEYKPESNHICLIYDNDEQRQKIVSDFMAVGIREGELVRYFTDRTEPEQIRSWLLNMGIELSDIEKNGSFIVANAEKAYCPNGKFDPQEMIDGCIQRYKLAEEAGQSCVRSCGEMSWVFKNIPGSERWLEYEALLNTVDVSFPHIGMCQYDARLFDGATLFRVLQLHPYMIAQGQIVSNPYYIKTEEQNK